VSLRREGQTVRIVASAVLCLGAWAMLAWLVAAMIG
jgi:hypothetical protein